jgi:hypothetical protein
LLRCFINSLIHWFIYSLVHWFIHSVVRGFFHVISLASQPSHSLMRFTIWTGHGLCISKTSPWAVEFL